MSAPVDPWAQSSRTEISFSILSGKHKHRYLVMDQLIVDDLLANMAKAEAHLVNSGEDLTHFPERAVKDYLIGVHSIPGGV